MRTSAMTFGLLVSAASFAQEGVPSDADVVSEAPRIHARTLSLAEMTTAAARIVRGRVEQVEPRTIQIDGGGQSLELRVIEITLMVEESLKGDVVNGAELTIRQYSDQEGSVREGEEVLWYLPQESRLGLVAPLGIYSGHFKIVDDENRPGEKVAINLAANQGLWSDDRSLLRSSPISRGVFRQTARAATASADEYDRAMAVANGPNQPGQAIPLSVITSASKAILEGQQ